LDARIYGSVIAAQLQRVRSSDQLKYVWIEKSPHCRGPAVRALLRTGTSPARCSVGGVMASNRTVYHVVPDAAGERWVVSQENGEYRQEYGTKDEAVNAAKDRARREEPSQVKVHKHDGNMEYESTYGEDPRRSPS
jgi:hypothetical protein